MLVAPSSACSVSLLLAASSPIHSSFTPPPLVHSLTHPLTHSHPPTHSFTHSLTHSLTHPLTHSLTHSLHLSPSARAIRAASPTPFDTPRSMTPLESRDESPLPRVGSLGGGSPGQLLDNMGLVDWSFAKNELLKKTGRNISTRQEYEEK